jgi:hypothetical protein
MFVQEICCKILAETYPNTNIFLEMNIKSENIQSLFTIVFVLAVRYLLLRMLAYQPPPTSKLINWSKTILKQFHLGITVKKKIYVFNLSRFLRIT